MCPKSRLVGIGLKNQILTEPSTPEGEANKAKATMIIGFLGVVGMVCARGEICNQLYGHEA